LSKQNGKEIASEKQDWHHLDKKEPRPLGGVPRHPLERKRRETLKIPTEKSFGSYVPEFKLPQIRAALENRKVGAHGKGDASEEGGQETCTGKSTGSTNDQKRTSGAGGRGKMSVEEERKSKQ